MDVSLSAAKLRLLDSRLATNGWPPTSGQPPGHQPGADGNATVWLKNLGGSRHLQWRRCEPLQSSGVELASGASSRLLLADAPMSSLKKARLKVWECELERPTNYDLRTVIDVQPAPPSGQPAEMPVPRARLWLAALGPAVWLAVVIESCWTVLRPASPFEPGGDTASV